MSTKNWAHQTIDTSDDQSGSFSWFNGCLKLVDEPSVQANTLCSLHQPVHSVGVLTTPRGHHRPCVFDSCGPGTGPIIIASMQMTVEPGTVTYTAFTPTLRSTRLMTMAIMELEATSPTRTLLEELGERMTTWESAPATCTGHGIIRIFTSVEALLEI